MIHVYVISKPGNDLDGEEEILEGETPEAIAARVPALQGAFGYTLILIGTKEGAKFTPCVDYDALPWWAQRYVDEQTPKVTVRRQRRTRVRAA